MRACVRACVRACACVHVCVCACVPECVVLAVRGSVHRMVRNLGDVMLEQDCSVLGASDGPECARFNRSGQRYACVLREPPRRAARCAKKVACSGADVRRKSCSVSQSQQGTETLLPASSCSAPAVVHMLHGASFCIRDDRPSSRAHAPAEHARMAPLL